MRSIYLRRLSELRVWESWWRCHMGYQLTSSYLTQRHWSWSRMHCYYFNLLIQQNKNDSEQLLTESWIRLPWRHLQPPSLSSYITRGHMELLISRRHTGESDWRLISYLLYRYYFTLYLYQPLFYHSILYRSVSLFISISLFFLYHSLFHGYDVYPVSFLILCLRFALRPPSGF